MDILKVVVINKLEFITFRGLLFPWKKTHPRHQRRSRAKGPARVYYGSE